MFFFGLSDSIFPELFGPVSGPVFGTKIGPKNWTGYRPLINILYSFFFTVHVLGTKFGSVFGTDFRKKLAKK